MHKAPARTFNHHAGFSLVELSIVLVIVGLIAGGVLAGSALIKAMEVRKTISDIEQLRTAYHWYSNKYGCLPGDCEDTSAHFSEYMENGDGDGKIECGTACGSAVSEAYYGMRALQLSGLVPPLDADAYWPVAIVPCTIGIEYFDPADWLTLYGAQANNYILIVDRLLEAPWERNCLTPVDAANMDRKLDDGMPATGRYLSRVNPNDSRPNSVCANVPYDEGAQYESAYVKAEELGCSSYIPLN